MYTYRTGRTCGAPRRWPRAFPRQAHIAPLKTEMTRPAQFSACAGTNVSAIYIKIYIYIYVLCIHIEQVALRHHCSRALPRAEHAQLA